MKKIAFLIFLTSLFSNSQEIKISYENTNDGYRLIADNFEYCPVSVNFEYSLQNLKLNGNHIVVLKPNEKSQIIGELKIIDKRKPYKFSYKTNYNFGDTFQEEYDSEYEYSLPFSKDSSYTVIQGYNGDFSHKGQLAIDFIMSVGTPIHAARNGVVIKIVESNNQSCPTSDCEQFNNLIRIMHLDGTFADYLHIKQNGAKVNKGDIVKKGELIGYSGNTGWSSIPHLHFVVYLQQIYDRRTLPTSFKVKRSEKALKLEKGKRYLNSL